MQLLIHDTLLSVPSVHPPALSALPFLPNGGEEEEEELFFPRPRLVTGLWLLPLVTAVAALPEVRSVTGAIEVEPTPVLVPYFSMLLVAGPQAREKPLPLFPDATAPLEVPGDEMTHDGDAELIEGGPPISEVGG